MDTLVTPFIERMIDQSLAIGIIIAVMAFIDKRLWPWFTREYWPHLQKMREEETRALALVARSLQVLEGLSIRSETILENISERLAEIESKLSVHIAWASRVLEKVSDLEEIWPKLTNVVERMSTSKSVIELNKERPSKEGD